MRSKRILSGLLTLILLCSLLPAPVYAEAGGYNEVTVSVSDGKKTRNVTCLLRDDGDLYFSAEDLAGLTGYRLLEKDGKILFTLGIKNILIDTADGRMKIDVLHYELVDGEEVISHNGKSYLSGLQLLPWMNVSFLAEGGVLYLIPDSVSLWSAAEGIFAGDNLFDLEDFYSGSFRDMAALTSMRVFDDIVNLRFDRLVPAAGEGSKYDYECRVDALLELASDTPFSGKGLEDKLGNVLELNSTFDDLESAMGLDALSEEERRLNVVNYGYKMGEYILDQDIVDAYSDFHLRWSQCRELVGTYAEMSKYVDVLRFGKAYELMLHADTGYRALLRNMEANPTDRITLNKAMAEANLRLEEKRGAYLSYAIDLGKTVLEDMEGELRDKALQSVSMDGAFKDLTLYTKFAKLFYSTVFPVANSYEAVSKLDSYLDIMFEAVNAAYRLEAALMTEENIRLLRSAYTLALKASRKCYQIIEDLLTIKFLGITLQDGSKLMDYITDKLDARILDLTVAANAQEHDSVDGKERMRRELQAAFDELTAKFSRESGGNDAGSAETSAVETVEASRTKYLPSDFALADYPQFYELLGGMYCYALVDLTHNGQPELLLLQNPNDDGYYGIYVYDLDGMRLYCDDIGGFHDNEYDLYLTCFNGLWYLLKRNVGAGTGLTWDGFDVFYLSEDGRRVDFDYNEGLCYNYETEKPNPAVSNRFYRALNVYFARSALVLGLVAEQGTELPTAVGDRPAGTAAAPDALKQIYEDYYYGLLWEIQWMGYFSVDFFEDCYENMVSQDFYLGDIDHDGIPEMVCMARGDESHEGWYGVYTYRGGEVAVLLYGTCLADAVPVVNTRSSVLGLRSGSSCFLVSFEGGSVSDSASVSLSGNTLASSDPLADTAPWKGRYEPLPATGAKELLGK